MTQFDFGTMDPGTTSGDDLAEILGNVRDAVNTNHKGATRPSYAVAGMLWIDDSSSPWLVQYYDGSNDVTLAKIDPSTSKLTLVGAKSYMYEETVTGSVKSTFSIPDGYSVGAVAVYQNGLRLPNSEFTATSGTDIVLDTPAAVDDVMLFEWLD